MSYDMYLYGMILRNNSFLLEGDYPEADTYAEIRKKYSLPGGETSTCATVLLGLGRSVKMDGTFMGKSTMPFIKKFYEGAPCDLSGLHLDETFDGLDPIMRNLVKKVLYADDAERGSTAVITSHSLRELEDTCDQLALLHKGGIVFESDVQNLKTTLFKVQIAFDHDYDHTLFSGFDVLNFAKHGSVSNLIVRGDRDKVVQDLRTKSPILMEVLPLSLEEVFLYEMESLGYSFGDELK